jgi:hypothetical protein
LGIDSVANQKTFNQIGLSNIRHKFDIINENPEEIIKFNENLRIKIEHNLRHQNLAKEILKRIGKWFPFFTKDGLNTATVVLKELEYQKELLYLALRDCPSS